MITAEDIAVVLAMIRREVGRIKRGPKGDKGARGEPGRDGRDGINGEDGAKGVGIASISDSVLSRNVTIALDDGRKFSFRKPRDGRDGRSIKGKDGRDGVDGAGIRNVSVLPDDRLLLTLTTGEQIRTNPIPAIHGKDGRDGKDGTVLHHGFRSPKAELGARGDWYLDRNDGAWWQKQAAWELLFRPTKAGVSGGLSISEVEKFICQFLRDTTVVQNVSAYTVTRKDRSLYVIADTQDVEITLMDTAGEDGFEACPIEIKRSEDSAFNVNVSAIPGQTIEGEVCRTINVAGASLRLKIVGADWKEY